MLLELEILVSQSVSSAHRNLSRPLSFDYVFILSIQGDWTSFCAPICQTKRFELEL